MCLFRSEAFFILVADSERPGTIEEPLAQDSKLYSYGGRGNGATAPSGSPRRAWTGSMSYATSTRLWTRSQSATYLDYAPVHTTGQKNILITTRPKAGSNPPCSLRVMTMCHSDSIGSDLCNLRMCHWQRTMWRELNPVNMRQ